MPFGPLLAWKRGDIRAVSQRLMAAFAGALAVVAAVLIVAGFEGVLPALGIGLGAWLILGAATDLALKCGVMSVPPSVMFRRLTGLPRSMIGTAMAHAGLGITLIGIVSISAFQTEHIVTMKPGETISVGGYTLRFEQTQRAAGPNYSEDQAVFVLSQPEGDVIAEIISAKRLYTARQMPTTEAGIETLGFSQVYVSDRRSNSRWRSRRACLVETLCDIHLAWRGGDDAGRWHVTRRQAVAYWCTIPAQDQDRSGACRMMAMAQRLTLAILLMVAACFSGLRGAPKRGA